MIDKFPNLKKQEFIHARNLEIMPDNIRTESIEGASEFFKDPFEEGEDENTFSEQGN